MLKQTQSGSSFRVQGIATSGAGRTGAQRDRLPSETHYLAMRLQRQLFVEPHAQPAAIAH
jgi:hypothetical protein